MSDKKKIYKPKPVSGFPEWIPEVRRAEQMWFDHIRRVFESYGFCNIETPSVEELDAINAKGGDGEADADKEMYVIERLHKEDNDKEARLALHFDQTVPLARYTAQHFNDLIFPFKRYQMQRVWRGERPQAGRFREFYQCDIDVINVDNLPMHFDAEMPAIMWEILSSLPGMENERIQIRISNRKILMGFLETRGITSKQKTTQITRAVDKLEKIGIEETIKEILFTLGHYNDNSQLVDENNNPYNYARQGEPEFINVWSQFLQFISKKIKTSNELEYTLSKNTEIDTNNPTIKEGIEELSFVLDQLSHLPEGAVVADLSIVRGLDYYTGTVYETVFVDDPSYGSICSGGRYDDLAGNYINKHLPGVGISLGFSRLFDRIRTKGQLPQLGASPADIFMVMPNEEMRSAATQAANTLRQRGYKVELAHGGKLKKQLATAEKKGIPYVWFPPFEDGSPHEVKNMSNGEQKNTTPQDWTKDT